MSNDSLPETIADVLRYARQLYTQEESILTATSAQALLGYVVSRGRAWLLAHGEETISSEDAQRFVDLVTRAAGGEPLPHLTGEREFYGYSFHVTPDVLIPRPETESLIDMVGDWLKEYQIDRPRIVDVGTGSGAIAVTLALEHPQAQVCAVDVSWPALKIAQYNVEQHQVANRVSFAQGDLLTAFRGPFDAIIANLPYIAHEEIATLEVAKWEPHMALDGGPDGLTLIRQLLKQAPSRMNPGGLLLLEIGYDQGGHAAELCRAAFPSADVTVLPDLAKLDRIVKVALP